ncbi:unnamed protein product [Auanema sp. JU1783]|nr:unnamed protein product [Auanema sp. JU1783]
MSYSSEFIQDAATTDIVKHFPEAYQSERPQRLYYKDGEMFVKDDFIKQHPIPKSCFYQKNKGEILLESSEDDSYLIFDCYCEEEGNDEHIHHLRAFKLHYHFSDNSFSLQEPKVENSGFFQGRIFWHQKIPLKNCIGGPYTTWKDLNISQDIDLFGKIYRITNCDSFTKNFLLENGIKVNDPEKIPEDPWLVRRRTKDSSSLKLDNGMTDFIPCPKVMAFRCCWLDTSTDFNSVRLKRIFRLTLFTMDNTISLTEETKEFEGQLFLRRMQLPIPPTGTQRKTFYRNHDFRPGVWIEVFSRPMFIFECVGYETRNFMKQQHGETEFGSSSNEILLAGPPPNPIYKEIQTLQFLAKMVDPPPKFIQTVFILTFDINKRIVNIDESGKTYKWSKGRSFLFNIDASSYNENQFSIGETVQFFRWHFLLMEGNKETEEYLKWKTSTS